jgi:nucleotide-binding universal stress UspA family protein
MLMVNLDLGHSNETLLTFAGDLAERFDAGLVGIAACQMTSSIYNDGYVAGELIDVARNAAQNDLNDAEAQFRLLIEKRLGTCDWRASVTFADPADFVARQARCADIIITGAPPCTGLGVEIGDLVMQSGRPVLSVPRDVGKLTLEHVIVAWKDTREARHAVAAALPVLKLASRISVIEVAAPVDLPAAQLHVADVVQWLARHGAQADAIAAPAGHDETRVFADFVKTHRGDMIVAGAYGHSRLREWALGGFTRHLLNESGVCALVVH